MARRTLILVFLLLAAATTAAAQGLTKKQQELQRIKQEMEEKQLQIQRAARKERSVLWSLERIDRAIQTEGEDLQDMSRRTRETEAALAEVEQQAREVRAELPRLQAAYGRRLRALYKMSRSGGYSLAILSADSFAAAYRRTRALGAIAEQDRQLIAEYGETLRALAEQEQLLTALRRSLQEDRRSAREKRESLTAQRRQKAEILASLKQEKSVYEATLKELEESSTNLWAMIRLAERSRRSGDGETEQGGQRLPWPVKGRVVTNFGRQQHPQFGTMVFRRGIEIAAREGDPVLAVKNGQVAYADWYRGYGRLVIIDHGAGMYTLYGHLSRLGVRGGEGVEQGQEIGLAGETGSLAGTKLYFELRRNGEAEDPLAWLVPRHSAQR